MQNTSYSYQLLENQPDQIERVCSSKLRTGWGPPRLFWCSSFLEVFHARHRGLTVRTFTWVMSFLPEVEEDSWWVQIFASFSILKWLWSIQKELWCLLLVWKHAFKIKIKNLLECRVENSYRYKWIERGQLVKECECLSSLSTHQYNSLQLRHCIFSVNTTLLLFCKIYFKISTYYYLPFSPAKPVHSTPILIGWTAILHYVAILTYSIYYFPLCIFPSKTFTWTFSTITYSEACSREKADLFI